MSSGKSIGGIVGENKKQIIGCENSAYVQGYELVGGIVGAVGEANNSEIEKCYNIAEIYATYNNAGGICGYKVIGKIYNCYNLGRVTGKQLIGGINGAAGKGGFETVYTYNCYNLGTLSGGNYTAQITGYPNVNGGSSLDVNCYTTNVTVEGLNEGEYSDNVWIEDNGINNGYPILKWQVNEKN